jgi:hypothetical protein
MVSFLFELGRCARFSDTSEGTGFSQVAGVSFLQRSHHGLDILRETSKPDATKGTTNTSLQQTLARMTYWHTDDSVMPSTSKYILFTGDAGGPNNIRLGWEMTGLIAQATKRTLVLPPAWKMYLLDWGPGRQRLPSEMADNTTTAAEDLINLAQLKANLPTLTADEFLQEAGTSWHEATKAAARVGEAVACKFSTYEELKDQRFVFLDGELREGFACAEWWKRGGPTELVKTEDKIGDRDWSLLTHGFVWHKDAFDIAAKVVNFLGIFEYNALHARYNDFQYTESRQGAAHIWDKWEDAFKSAPKIYVASDEPEKIKALKRMEGVELFTFEDMLQTVLKDVKPQYSPSRWFKLTGPVEELICTYAKIFVGTKDSSFSGHIDRMRIHAQAPVTQMLTHTNPVELEELLPDIHAWENSSGKLQIARPYPSHGDTFLQISSEKDEKQQLPIVGHNLNVRD